MLPKRLPVGSLFFRYSGYVLYGWWAHWSDIIKVQCQNCRKREEERQWKGTIKISKPRRWNCRTTSELRRRVNSLMWTTEGLFSAAKIARLKNTASLPFGKLAYLHMRFPRTNATLAGWRKRRAKKNREEKNADITFKTENSRLKKEIAELKNANDILKDALTFFIQDRKK